MTTIAPITVACLWRGVGTFLLCCLPGHAEPETGSQLSVPGFPDYYDGDEFRVAVAVPLPALLYVRLRPRETPGTSLPPRGPGLSPDDSLGVPGEKGASGRLPSSQPFTFSPNGAAFALSRSLILRPHSLHPAGYSRTWTLGRSSWLPGALWFCPSAACTNSPA